jgi:hypothetical protein
VSREQARQARDAWTRIPVAARESLLLRVLGDERLIIPDLTSRVNAELGYPSGPEAAPAVCVGDVRHLVTRMHRAGHLERVAEPAPGANIRHRYFCKRTLDGPIVDLERAYQEGGE